MINCIIKSQLIWSTWSVQKVSRILNFRGLRKFEFRFFVTLCWYSYHSLMSTSSAILNVQLIFNSYFAWIWLVFDFCLFQKNESKNLFEIFRVKRSIRNITYKLCAICLKQSTRNARTCGRTKIGFCPCSHIVACARIFGHKQHNNVTAATVFLRSGPL